MQALAGFARRAFGLISLIASLALLAVTPILQFLVLGALVSLAREASRRRAAKALLEALDKAAVGGVVVLGFWLTLLPLRFISSLLSDARLIDPGGAAERRLSVALGLGVLLGLTHVLCACLRGGRARDFLSPWLHWRRLRGDGLAGDLLAERSGGFLSALNELGLWSQWRLGLGVFVASLAWIAAPTSLLAAGHERPLLGLLGALSLAPIAVVLPFLQVRCAREARFSAHFEVFAVVDLMRHAPVACGLAALVSLVTALPLYLLKVELLPREAGPLPSLLFVLFMGGSRLFVGWSYARALGFAEREPRAATTGTLLWGVVPVHAPWFPWLWRLGAPGGEVSFGVRVLAAPFLTLVALATLPLLMLRAVLGRSGGAGGPASWLWLQLGRALMAPSGLLYALIVFFSQYTSWGGALSLYGQHAFLLPVPFVSFAAP